MEIHHYKYARITIDPDKCFGKPCIRGYRMPVASVLNYLGAGMSIEQMLQEWRFLEREDIFEALGYAAETMDERFVPHLESA
jgi:uncharacterized protein (DUF433 family)